MNAVDGHTGLVLHVAIRCRGRDMIQHAQCFWRDLLERLRAGTQGNCAPRVSHKGSKHPAEQEHETVLGLDLVALDYKPVIVGCPQPYNFANVTYCSFHWFPEKQGWLQQWLRVETVARQLPGHGLAWVADLDGSGGRKSKTGAWPSETWAHDHHDITTLANEASGVMRI